MSNLPVLPAPLIPLKPLATSGHRQVWLARDEVLDRLVVAKRLSGPKDLSACQSIPESLRSRVLHATPAAVYAVYAVEKRCWIVSEYIDGPALTAAHQRVDATVVIVLLAQLLEGIQALLEAGVVHGDLSPANVLIEHRGIARIIDFGIATELGGITSGAGTPGFTAPECAHRQPSTSTSDLWSLAALGTWLLTMQAPVWSDDTLATSIPVTGGHHNDPLTNRLMQLLRRGLARAPDERMPLSEWCGALDMLRRVAGQPGDLILCSFAQELSLL